jgi:hypothetical protein
MSGLLSATIISPEGTQFGLDFGGVEVDGGNFQTAKFLPEARGAEARDFSGFAQRKLANLEETNGQFKAQMLFDNGAWLPACQQKVVRIFYRQFGHNETISLIKPPVNGTLKQCLSLHGLGREYATNDEV